MDFETLLKRYRKTNLYLPERLLCLDPGETTGWALFINGTPTKWGQAMTSIEKKANWKAIEDLFVECQPTEVVAENYRVYSHKLEQHANAEIFTLRLIGVIDYLCWQKDIQIHYQMASMAKGFATDEKLKEWGYWKPGMRHSRDAIRHGCYYLLFNKEGS